MSLLLFANNLVKKSFKSLTTQIDILITIIIIIYNDDYKYDDDQCDEDDDLWGIDKHDENNQQHIIFNSDFNIHERL